jgi:phosphoglycolate phosphatase-like HAD superfamily hydrolase
MSEPSKRLILFDIDGTLLLTGGAGRMAFEEVFLAQHGMSGAWRDIHPDGRTDPFLIEELFQRNLGRTPSDAENRALVAAYTEAMERALRTAPNFRLMPGVAELLPLLARHDLLGLATGNFEATAYQKLTRAGLRNYFSFGGFGSDHADRLELTRLAMERGFAKLGRSLPPREILLVGDTVHDVACGQRLGMTTVAVATGSTPRAELAACEPDFLLEDLQPRKEVLEIFTRRPLR